MIIVFLSILILLNCIPLLTKSNFPKLEKKLIPLLVYFAILNISVVVLLFNGYHIKGNYTNLTIVIAFVILNIAYFCLIKITLKKIIIVVIMTSLMVVSSVLLMLGQVTANYQLNNTYNIKVIKGGILACGESINLNKTEFLVFDKDVHTINSLCLKGINKIEILEYTNQKLTFLIYHNGVEEKANPFRCEIENKNIW